jgi:hypothetical protein
MNYHSSFHLVQDKNGTHYTFQRGSQPQRQALVSSGQKPLGTNKQSPQIKAGANPVTQTIQNPAIPCNVSNKARPTVNFPWESGKQGKNLEPTALANAVGWDYVNRSALSPMIEGITVESFGS